MALRVKQPVHGIWPTSMAACATLLSAAVAYAGISDGDLRDQGRAEVLTASQSSADYALLDPPRIVVYTTRAPIVVPSRTDDRSPEKTADPKTQRGTSDAAGRKD